MRVPQTRLAAGETGAVAERELHAGLLDDADLAAVFEGRCEGLLVVGEVVPVGSCGFAGDFGVEVFAEDVAVEEDAFVFLLEG